MSDSEIALAIIEAQEKLSREAWLGVLNEHPIVVADAQLILGAVV